MIFPRAYIALLTRMAYRSRNPHRTYRKGIERYPLSSTRIKNWFATHPAFFVVSTGRTGTQWLSSLLGKAHGVHVTHEPLPLETWAHHEAARDPAAADLYVSNFRLKEICLRAHSLPAQHRYGEVNGILRRHIEPLRQHLPEMKLVHLVRDGRDVVRSIVSRGVYGNNHPVYRRFVPPPVDAYAAGWQNLSEFERTCWIWQWENQYMRKHIPNCARFEDITTSYAAFSDQILMPLDLHIDEATWQASIKRPQNATARHKLAAWDDWTQDQQTRFNTICGDEMRAYGYERSPDASWQT